MKGMRIKYFLGQVKDRMTVGGQRILGVLMLLLTVVSCAIENDIPYPIVEASIESMVVEGQRGADSNVFAEATINKSARTVTIYVNDSVDVTKLKVTCLKITPGAELIPDSTACVDFQKFPAEGFTSLDSIPASSNTRMDFSSPVHFTLRTYQDYVWTVSVQQLIQRDVEVEGMVDCVIDDNSRVVIVYVGQDQDLTNLNVTKMNLGGEFGTVSPDPTIIKDYSSPVKFYVRRSWEEYSYEWTVYVYKDSEEAGGGTTEAFAMTTRATVNGKIQSGKTPVVEYCKQNATSWTTVPAANVSVSGNSFTATLTGLNASTAYKYRISVDGTVGSEQTFTTAAATPLENGSMEEWSQDDKQWNPWTAGKDAFWGTGNKGSKFINKNITSPVDDSVSGKAAYLESMNALNLKLAAGNLFTGDFELDGMNGLLHFGRPFTSFPTSLRLYYKYTPATIDMIGDNVGDLATLKGQTDMFQIYIALSDKSEPYEIRNNPKNRQLFDPEDDGIIAYGEYTSSETVSTYKQLEIPLEYRATNRTPKYIIVVASSSKYGDYYIGGVGSKLWLDEMELVYE